MEIEADDDTEEVESENVEIEADDDTLEVESSTNFVPRVPAKAIKCAVRKRSCRLLWLHEFYIVYGNKRKKTNPYVYQSLQFLFGSELPAGVVRFRGSELPAGFLEYAMFLPTTCADIANVQKATCFTMMKARTMPTSICMEKVLR